ncbi:hypothetical protein FB567DRAFT_596183 [Paraphoma chrysanthemicola]|uniref:Uncharacterized protein n=1 Tax=Paraphoma chrysanthemicola TaxID=798071 RepID=A0A8K0R171_9PLEO|nr:hypothetical protein FB567DRAFT_596183 [Paraphoma chrysanthemicola]
MEPSICLRQLLRAPVYIRNTVLLPPSRPHFRTFALLAQTPTHTRSLSLPRIIQPSFWASMIPKPLRRRSEVSHEPRGWNPATPYIILGLLVGSQAIQILWLKQEKGHALRRAEAKIVLLKEVIERVQRGEDVDVEKMLGTGDAVKEKEWAEVLKEIEEEETLFQSKKRRKALRLAAEEEAAQEQERNAKEFVQNEQGDLRPKVESVNGVRFY